MSPFIVRPIRMRRHGRVGGAVGQASDRADTAPTRPEPAHTAHAARVGESGPRESATVTVGGQWVKSATAGTERGSTPRLRAQRETGIRPRRASPQVLNEMHVNYCADFPQLVGLLRVRKRLTFCERDGKKTRGCALCVVTFRMSPMTILQKLRCNVSSPRVHFGTPFSTGPRSAFSRSHIGKSA